MVVEKRMYLWRSDWPGMYRRRGAAGMEQLGNAVIWFRNDLRLQDNPAVWEATRYVEASRTGISSARLYGLYVEAPFEWRSLQHWGLAKADYYHRSVAVLRRRVEGKPWGGRLLRLQIKETEFATPEAYYTRLGEDLVRVLCAHGIQAVFMNEEYDAVGRDRDVLVKRALDAAGIAHHTTADQCAVPPGKILTKTGTPFKVFTQFKKSWAAWIEEHGLETTRPTALATNGHPRETDEGASMDEGEEEGEDLPLGYCREEWPELDLEGVRRAFPAGEEAAMARLEDFLQNRSSRYHEDRDYFVEGAASRMSAALAIGTISLKQCLLAAQTRNRGALLTGQPGLVHWISELCWRDFYRHVMVAFPHVTRGHSFRPEYEHLAWRAWPVDETTGTSSDGQAEEDFRRWCEGRTGVPIVDAGMRQLRREGWLNNRLRMIVAMYLCKDLLIHWRRGERFFMEHLVDYDFGSNNGGWQWSASTGTDAQPYFRIFNPLLQSEKFDSQGEYLRRHVEELKGVPAPAIHQPDQRLSKEAFGRLGYPKAMVEHHTAKDKVRALFAATTGKHELARE